MKKYVFLFRGGMPKPEEAEEHMKKWGPWIMNLSQGKQTPGEPFQPTGKVVASGGNISDVPMSQDMMTGYFTVEASDYDEAVKKTEGCPIFETGGTIEVREVIPMDMPIGNN